MLVVGRSNHVLPAAAVDSDVGPTAKFRFGQVRVARLEEGRLSLIEADRAARQDD